MKTLQCLNIDDKEYTSKAYRVELGAFGSFDGIIFANCESDAIDVLIDAYDNADHVGWFLSEDDLGVMTEEELENFIYGGNYCKYLSFEYSELRITEVNVTNILVEYNA